MGDPLGNRTLLVHSEQGMGDIIQFVPSQRFTKPFTKSPLDLYRALRTVNRSSLRCPAKKTNLARRMTATQCARSLMTPFNLWRCPCIRATGS